MDPVALHIGPLTIRWYGVFAALGFLAAFWLLQYRGSRRSIGGKSAGDIAYLGLVGGIVGARVLYVFQNASYFASHPLEIIRIDHGGLVFYGGFIAAAVLIAWSARKRGHRVAQVADLVAPVLPLGHALGRIGCLLNGCCFGKPWEGCCAVHYPAGSDVALAQHARGLLEHGTAACLPVFPIQALAAALNLMICGGLLLIERRLRREGQLFGLYLTVYAAVRFATEFLRGDYLSRFHGLTPAQWICLGLFPLGLGLFLWSWKRGRAVAPLVVPAGETAS